MMCGGAPLSPHGRAAPHFNFELRPAAGGIVVQRQALVHCRGGGSMAPRVSEPGTRRRTRVATGAGRCAAHAACSGEAPAPPPRRRSTPHPAPATAAQTWGCRWSAAPAGCSCVESCGAPRQTQYTCEAAEGEGQGPLLAGRHRVGRAGSGNCSPGTLLPAAACTSLTRCARCSSPARAARAAAAGSECTSATRRRWAASRGRCCQTGSSARRRRGARPAAPRAPRNLAGIGAGSGSGARGRCRGGVQAGATGAAGRPARSARAALRAGRAGGSTAPRKTNTQVA